jgi:hypothetical protein
MYVMATILQISIPAILHSLVHEVKFEIQDTTNGTYFLLSAKSIPTRPHGPTESFHLELSAVHLVARLRVCLEWLGNRSRLPHIQARGGRG